VKAYQVWADALKPILTELLGPPARWITPTAYGGTIPLRDTDWVRRQTDADMRPTACRYR